MDTPSDVSPVPIFREMVTRIWLSDIEGDVMNRCRGRDIDEHHLLPFHKTVATKRKTTMVQMQGDHCCREQVQCTSYSAGDHHHNR